MQIIVNYVIINLGADTMKNHQSEEDYLENILILSQTNSNVHSIDIVNYMNFSKPSVSVAVHKLIDKGYITMNTNGVIRLTDTGEKIAKKTYEKHLVLSGLLMKIGVPEDIALEDACEIEHCISDTSFEKLKDYYKEVINK